MSKQQMYSSPVVLNSVAHKNLKVAPVKDYKFAKGFNSCIALGQEFFEASKSYPIVFSPGPSDVLTPVVLLGVTNNLFVDDEGRWQTPFYIPAFIRRYPYILAEGLSQDGSLTVCIDGAFEGFNAEDGERLFTDDGEKTAALDRAMQFLTIYQQQFEVTKGFISFVKDLNIFKAVDANINFAGGGTFTIKNLSIVDEQALMNLSDSDLVTLVRRGYLAWIYAHLFSITNFIKITGRAG